MVSNLLVEFKNYSWWGVVENFDLFVFLGEIVGLVGLLGLGCMEIV